MIEVLKTCAFFRDHDEGVPHLIDTIFHEGQWWLVGTWLEPIAGGERVPETLVRLSGLRYQEVNELRYRFLLNNSIPKSVPQGKEQDGYVVVRYPVPFDTQLPSGGQLH